MDISASTENDRKHFIWDYVTNAYGNCNVSFRKFDWFVQFSKALGYQVNCTCDKENKLYFPCFNCIKSDWTMIIVVLMDVSAGALQLSVLRQLATEEPLVLPERPDDQPAFWANLVAEIQRWLGRRSSLLMTWTSMYMCINIGQNMWNIELLWICKICRFMMMHSRSMWPSFVKGQKR